MNEDLRILIVDDEIQLVELVAAFLEKDNYTVFKAHDGEALFPILEQERIDLIVLDVMMPKVDGFTALKRIREKWNIPIIMLTAKGEEHDRVHGLKMGADDYVVKPFSPKELVARIEALLRRSTTYQQEQSNNIMIGNVEIDKLGRIVKLDGEPVHLTKKEYGLLLYLVEHPGQVLSREQLLDAIWGMDYYSGTLRTIDTHVKTLRSKLGDVGDRILTIWGIGYKFEE